MMWLGLQGLTAEALRAAFRGNSLEPLVRVLVEEELRIRGAVGPKVEGPAREGVADGGRDVEWHCGALPASAAVYRSGHPGSLSIVEDDLLGFVSCKSNEAVDEVRKEFYAEAAAPSERARRLLNDGARFVAVTTAQLVPSQKAPRAALSGKDWLVQELLDRYETSIGRSRALLSQQIDVLDGNDLVRAIRTLPSVRLAREYGQALGAREWPLLRSLADAKSLHKDQRSMPRYVADLPREAAGRALQEIARGERSQVVLVGPPGVGKTRCLLEALDAHRDEAIYIDTYRVAFQALAQDLLGSAPSALLVVDDVPHEEVELLLRQFGAARSAPGISAQIIVLCPSGREPERVPESELLVLPRLEATEHRRLVESVLKDSSLVDKVVRFTLGFPYFAVLVARDLGALAGVPPRLESTNDAAKIAIRGTSGSRDLLLQRSRALFAVILMHRRPWPEDDAMLGTLAECVELTRRELVDALDECHERGIVRRGQRYYVTPAVLEREVWAILCEPGPPGPRGARLLRRVQGLPDGALGEFLKRMKEDWEIEPPALRALGAAVSDSLEHDAREIAALSDPTVAALLPFSAQHAPETVASWLPALVSRTPAEELRANRGARRPMVAALEALVRQGVAFEAVEAALFRLRTNENEPWVSNASRLWMSLFSPALGLVPIPFERRVRVLRERCLATPAGPEDEADQLSAIDALADLLDYRASYLVRSPEVESPSPTDAEVREGRRQLVEVLFWAAFWAPSARAARRAQDHFVRLFPRLVSDLATISDDQLTSAARSLGEESRASLRTELSTLRGADPALDRVLEILEVHTRPAADQYRARLLDHLSVPMYRSHRDVDYEAKTHALAVEGLAAPDFPLLRCLDVLALRVASSAMGFVIEGGKLDADARMLGPLLAGEPDTNIVSGYALGHVEAGRDAMVAAWVRAWSVDERLRDCALATIGRCSASPAVIALAPQVLSGPPFSPGLLRFALQTPWRGADLPVRLRMIKALIEYQGAAGAWCALDQLVFWVDVPGGLDKNSVPTIVRLLERTVPDWNMDVRLYDDAFERVLLWLEREGAVGEAIEATLRLVGAESTSLPVLARVVPELAERHPDAFWMQLEAALSGHGLAVERTASTLGRIGVWKHLPEKGVLAWVGDDAYRAWIALEMLRFEEDALPKIAVVLLTRFGATSNVARGLVAQIESRISVKTGMADAYASLRDRALRWTETELPEVRSWALRAAEHFDAERRKSAHYEQPNRRVGT